MRRDRDVERAAAEVVDGDRLVLPALLEAVGERGGRRLVDDPEDLEPRDAPRVARRLALRVVEVGRDGDDRLADLLADRLLAELLDLAEDEGGDLLGGVVAVPHPDLHVPVRGRNDRIGEVLAGVPDLGVVPLGANEPLDRVDRLRRVRDRLALGDLADEPLAVLGERDDRRGGPRPLAVRDDLGRPELDDGRAGVGRPEVDADHLAQALPPAPRPAHASRAGADGAADTLTIAGRSSRSLRT